MGMAVADRKEAASAYNCALQQEAAYFFASARKE
jgi:hypothetical protein